MPRLNDLAVLVNQKSFTNNPHRLLSVVVFLSPNTVLSPNTLRIYDRFVDVREQREVKIKLVNKLLMGVEVICTDT